MSDQDLPNLLRSIDGHYPGIRNYIVDERGALRKHVLIFINGEQINDRKNSATNLPLPAKYTSCSRCQAADGN